NITRLKIKSKNGHSTVVRLGIDQLVSRCDQVGFEQVVVVPDAFGIRVRAARGAPRTIGRDAVIGMRVGSKGIGGTDRDYRRLVTGRVNLSIDFVAIRVFAIIAGSG